MVPGNKLEYFHVTSDCGMSYIAEGCAGNLFDKGPLLGALINSLAGYYKLLAACHVKAFVCNKE